MIPSHAQAALVSDHLTIAGRLSPGEVTLIVRGEIDIASAPVLESELLEAERSRPRRIVLDFAELSFVDSTGIHLLIEAQRRADARGRQLLLTNVPAHAKRVFSLTGITAQLTIE